MRDVTSKRFSGAYRALAIGLAMSVSLVLAACGGGGGSDFSTPAAQAPAPAPTPTPTPISEGIRNVSVTGLGSGQFVTLLDNNANPLMIVSDGTTPFPSTWAANRSYNITVQSSTLGVACTVQSPNSGAVGATDVTVNVNCAAAPITESVLYAFQGGTDGQIPVAGLVMDSAGNLYGTTQDGGSGNNGLGNGTVFKLTPAGNGGYTESVLYTFQGGTDGQSPVAGLVMDSAGNLYGTTKYGGSGNNGFGNGTVFKLTPAGNGGYTESVLYAFNGGSDGAAPAAGLVMDSAGNLYGTTEGGGSGNNGFGNGTAFKLTPAGNGGYTESVLYAFNGGSDGAAPAAGLVMDSAGNLYGTTVNGGSVNGYGTVFKLTPSGNGSYTESVLYAFQGGTDGQYPAAGLVMDSAGNFYGTTQGGGSGNGYGAVFKLTPAGNVGYTESVLYAFKSAGDSDGQYPVAGLVMDSAGNLYGTTEVGGSGNNGLGNGTVFKLRTP